jgi:hypothetical protein
MALSPVAYRPIGTFDRSPESLGTVVVFIWI